MVQVRDGDGAYAEKAITASIEPSFCIPATLLDVPVTRNMNRLGYSLHNVQPSAQIQPVIGSSLGQRDRDKGLVESSAENTVHLYRGRDHRIWPKTCRRNIVGIVCHCC